MKKTTYNFAKAIKVADEWQKPRELSANLKEVALRCAILNDNETGIVNAMQCAVLDVCNFLDAVEEREVEQ